MADTVIAARTIRAQQIITGADVKLITDRISGMATSVTDVVGLEAKRILYTGRPIGLTDVGPPALVERNQIVPLSFRSNTLIIQTDGRSLGRGGAGDTIRVLNLASRTTVNGTIGTNGTVWVSE